ncbi:UNVERIFIED_CONTAM: SCF ubiquitin ligase complex subunit cdc4 [Siphonaria sp. JEL0065]|nr:SCF ubiquitin ligase complex subunit cdc4 [Siphonaria sp. JEL0065]
MTIGKQVLKSRYNNHLERFKFDLSIHEPEQDEDLFDWPYIVYAPEILFHKAKTANKLLLRPPCIDQTCLCTPVFYKHAYNLIATPSGLVALIYAVWKCEFKALVMKQKTTSDMIHEADNDSKSGTLCFSTLSEEYRKILPTNISLQLDFILSKKAGVTLEYMTSVVHPAIMSTGPEAARASCVKLITAKYTKTLRKAAYLKSVNPSTRLQIMSLPEYLDKNQMPDRRDLTLFWLKWTHPYKYLSKLLMKSAAVKSHVVFTTTTKFVRKMFKTGVLLLALNEIDQVLHYKFASHENNAGEVDPFLDEVVTCNVEGLQTFVGDSLEQQAVWADLGLVDADLETEEQELDHEESKYCIDRLETDERILSNDAEEEYDSNAITHLKHSLLSHTVQFPIVDASRDIMLICNNATSILNRGNILGTKYVSFVFKSHYLFEQIQRGDCTPDNTNSHTENGVTTIKLQTDNKKNHSTLSEIENALTRRVGVEVGTRILDVLVCKINIRQAAKFNRFPSTQDFDLLDLVKTALEINHFDLDSTPPQINHVLNLLKKYSPSGLASRGMRCASIANSLSEWRTVFSLLPIPVAEIPTVHLQHLEISCASRILKPQAPMPPPIDSKLVQCEEVLVSTLYDIMVVAGFTSQPKLFFSLWDFASKFCNGIYARTVEVLSIKYKSIRDKRRKQNKVAKEMQTSMKGIEEPLNARRNLRSLDVSEFPLANTPTPPALKKFCFDLNGVPTRFTELDLYEDDLAKLNTSKHADRFSSTTTSATATSPTFTHHHLQHHTANLPSTHGNTAFTDKHQTSPLKNSRKRDHRGAAFVNPNHHHHQGDESDISQPIPLTPFPDVGIPLAAANLPPIITTANAMNSPVNLANNNNNGLVLGMDDPPNLPSPTMSPTATTPPPNAFVLPAGAVAAHLRNAIPTSPSNCRQRESTTVSRSLTPSPTSRFAKISSFPATLSDIPSIINTFDTLAPQLQSYLLLQLLRRCPSKTLQFVSTLILPALKQDFLGDLPAELAYQILSHLDLRTLSRVSRVCKKWRGVVDGEGAGIAVWKHRLSLEGWFSEAEVKGILERWVMWRRSFEIKSRRRRSSIEKGKDVVGKVVENVDSSNLDVVKEELDGSDQQPQLRKSPGLKVNTAAGKRMPIASVSMKLSGDSLNSSSTVFTNRVGDEPAVGLGLASFRSAASSLRRQALVDEDEDEENDQDSLVGSSHSGSDADYEFEEDEDDDFFYAQSGAADETSDAKRFLDYFASSHQCSTIVQDTVEWMKTLDEFTTGLSDSSSGASLFGNTADSAFRRGNRRLKISRIRTRLRKFIEECSKSELSQLALQIPYLYKGVYRRHHIIRRNWARGAQKTIEFPGHGNNVVTCLQFDNDKIVSGSDDQSIHIYDTNTGTLRRKLVGHDGGVWALQYWGDSLVSGSTDRTVRVWDMDTGLCTHLFEGHTSTVRCLMIVPPSPTAVYPFGANGRTGGIGFETSLEPSQPLVVTGSRDATLRVWRLPNPKTDKYHVPPNGPGVVHTHGDANNTYESGQNPYFMHVLQGHTNSVRAIAGHGRVLVSGSYDCTVRVWDLLTGESVYTFRGHREKVYSVGYSHELSRAVSGSLDASVKVWCTKTGVLLHNLEGHTSLVGLLELSADYLVSAAADQSLRIWAPGSGHCLAHLHGHPAAITCFHHDPKLNRIVSGSDGGVKLWELSSAVGASAGTSSSTSAAALGNATGVGPGFEFRQGPNGPEPVYGRFARDLVSGVAGVWRVRMDERRLVCAISKEGGNTWFQVLDFGENVAHGTVVQGTGDGGVEWMDEEDEDEEDHDDDDAEDDDGEDGEGGGGDGGENDDGGEQEGGAGGDDGGDGLLPPPAPEPPQNNLAPNDDNDVGAGGGILASLVPPIFGQVDADDNTSSSSAAMARHLRNQQQITRNQVLSSFGESSRDGEVGNGRRGEGVLVSRALFGTSSGSTSRAPRTTAFIDIGGSSSSSFSSSRVITRSQANASALAPVGQSAEEEHAVDPEEVNDMQ